MSAPKSILERPNIVFAILYGSQSTGEATPESDIDIGIFLDDYTTDKKYDEIFAIEEHYSEAGGDWEKLDITVLNNAEELPAQFTSTAREQAIFICGNREKFEEWKNG